MFNKIILAGNLTKDPELRYTPQGLPVASLPIAVNSKGKQSDDQKEETLFIEVIVFGRLAETSTEYLSKGRGIIVDGRLRERRWESQDGQKRSKYEVIANSVTFLPGRSNQPQKGSDFSDFPPPDETTDLEPF